MSMKMQRAKNTDENQITHSFQTRVKTSLIFWFLITELDKAADFEEALKIHTANIHKQRQARTVR